MKKTIKKCPRVLAIVIVSLISFVPFYYTLTISAQAFDETCKIWKSFSHSMLWSRKRLSGTRAGALSASGDRFFKEKPRRNGTRRT